MTRDEAQRRVAAWLEPYYPAEPRHEKTPDLHVALVDHVLVVEAETAARARREALEAALRASGAGRCSCHFARCGHDEAGDEIRALIEREAREGDQ